MESVTDKNKNINTKYTKEEINKKKEELRKCVLTRIIMKY